MKRRRDWQQQQQQRQLQPLSPMPPPIATTSAATAAAGVVAIASDAACSSHPVPYFHFGFPQLHTHVQQGRWPPSSLPPPSLQTPASAATVTAYTRDSTPHFVVDSTANTSNTLAVASLSPSFRVEEDCVDIDVEVNSNEVASVKDNVFAGDTPWEGMEFHTDEDAYTYYNSYARKIGFRIRKQKIDKSRSDPSKVISRTFVCNKAGKKWLTDKREFGKTITRRPDTRVGCEAEMKIHLTSANKWVVRKFVEKHSNHELSSPDKVLHHFSHKQKHRSETIRKAIEHLNEAGMGPSNIARVLNVGCEGEDGERITPQQCSDHIRTIRKNNIGNECISIIKNFQDRREIDPDFYFAMEVDHLGQMRSVFWADGRSRSSYLRLGDVVVFDTTYRTNQYSLSFAPFTGVNHHRQSILFGCALLSDEYEDTFIWLFTQWLKCMHGVTPKAIITDQDLAMRAAVKKVFPNTRHHFCSWHIGRHIADREMSLKKKYGDNFLIDFNIWFRSSTISKCEEKWNLLKEKYGIDEKNECWVSKMYNLREHWVDAYIKDTFWAGMTTSQRSESINAYFDTYVNAKTQLVDFIRQYDKAVANHRASESREDFMNLNGAPTMCLLSHLIEIQAAKIYTRSILKLFQLDLIAGMSLYYEEIALDGSKKIYHVRQQGDEGNKMDEVSYDPLEISPFICTCAMIVTDGYLCRHILHVLCHNQLQFFSESYMLHRWTMKARHRNIRYSNVMNIRSNPNDIQRGIIRLWVLRAKFNSALEVISESEAYMAKLENMSENLILDAEKEVRLKEVHVQAIGSQVGSSNPVILRDGEEIFLRDPDGPAKTKDRPRMPTRLVREVPEKKKRKCSQCQQLGHYRTNCPALLYGLNFGAKEGLAKEVFHP